MTPKLQAGCKINSLSFVFLVLVLSINDQSELAFQLHVACCLFNHIGQVGSGCILYIISSEERGAGGGIIALMKKKCKNIIHLSWIFLKV